MINCKNCGSYAINPRLHGRQKGVDLDLCDVCYWRKRAEEYPQKIYIRPVYNGSGRKDWDCSECEYRGLSEEWTFCPQCGAKLNWEEV